MPTRPTHGKTTNCRATTTGTAALPIFTNCSRVHVKSVLARGDEKERRGREACVDWTSSVADQNYIAFKALESPLQCQPSSTTVDGQYVKRLCLCTVVNTLRSIFSHASPACPSSLSLSLSLFPQYLKQPEIFVQHATDLMSLETLFQKSKPTRKIKARSFGLFLSFQERGIP